MAGTRSPSWLCPVVQAAGPEMKASCWRENYDTVRHVTKAEGTEEGQAGLAQRGHGSRL